STDVRTASSTSGPTNPRTRNTIAAITNAGTDVQTWRLMCSRTSTPTTCEARIVVSESGDVLSPRYAPETTAPAVISGETPRATAMPTNPTPTVPAVVHELPMHSATIPQITAAAT